MRERNRMGGFITATRESGVFKQIRSPRRVGQIVGMESKRNTRGTRCDYAMVRWDHLQTPSMHAIFRLERIPEP